MFSVWFFTFEIILVTLIVTVVASSYCFLLSRRDDDDIVKLESKSSSNDLQDGARWGGLGELWQPGFEAVESRCRSRSNSSAGE